MARALSAISSSKSGTLAVKQYPRLRALLPDVLGTPGSSTDGNCPGNDKSDRLDLARFRFLETGPGSLESSSMAAGDPVGIGISAPNKVGLSCLSVIPSHKLSNSSVEQRLEVI